jgi:hypothetical protein
MSVLQSFCDRVLSLVREPIGLAGLALTNTFVGEHMLVRMREFTHKCGHAGFVVEVRLRGGREPLIALFDELERRDVCELLQQCIATADERHRSET